MFIDDGDLTTDDFIVESGSNGAIDRTLSSGNYIVVVTPWNRTVEQAVAGVAFSARYELDIRSRANHWDVSIPELQIGIQGLTVDLNFADDTSPLYRVQSNSGWSMVVNTTDDLSGIVGNDLIGVHQFNTLRILDGASVDFGGDRIEVVDVASSEVRASRLFNVIIDDETLINHFAHTNVDGEIEVTGEAVYDNLNVTSPGLYFENLTVNNDLSLMSGAHLEVGSVVASTLTIDGSILSAESVQATNITMQNVGVLTTEQTTDPLNNLIVEATNITIDAGSSIDLDGKGLPPTNYSPSSGRYADPQLAGSGTNTTRSGGTYSGGGVLHLVADSLAIDGTISVNAEDNNTGNYPNGPSGGSIRMELQSLTGSGFLEADGGNAGNHHNSRPGHGGRIALYVNDNQFVGSVSVSGGDAWHETHYKGKAGTFYTRTLDPGLGNLLFENAKAVGAYVYDSVVEHIGRHTITGVTDLGGGLWEVDALPDTDVRIEQSVNLNNETAVYPFSIGRTQTVNIRFNNRSGSIDAFLFRDDGDLTTDDRITESSTSGSIDRSLAAGDYVLIATPWNRTTEEAVAGVAFNASFDVSIKTSEAIWPEPILEHQIGIQGLTVDLDLDDDTSPLFEVESNTPWKFVVEAPSGLGDVVGNELIGVHQFNNLNILDGASVDFRGDRVEVTDLSTTELRDSRIINAVISEELINHYGLTSVNSDIQLAGEVTYDNLSVTSSDFEFEILNVNNTLAIGNGARIEAETINAGTLLIDGATLVVQNLNVTGDVILVNGATITTLSASGDSGSPIFGQIFELVINADRVIVDDGSSIDVTGRGYPTYWYWPDYRRAANKTRSHGGGDAYGRYARAKFAGNSGERYNGHGGGVVEIFANSLQLDGAIRSDGGMGYRNRVNGAGGSVHIEVGELTGSVNGLVSASGGPSVNYRTSPAAAGGRISVYVDNRSGYNGSFLAHCSLHTRDSVTSGAGTIYIKESAQPFGDLIIDNAGRPAPGSSTPIEHIGRHTIDTVDDLGANQWRITVTSLDPWEEMNEAYDQGIHGLLVDLDIADTTSDYYPVVSNTTNSFVVESTVSLAGIEGNEIRGVHQFNALEISGSASVNFGGDHVEITDPINSNVTNAELLDVSLDGDGLTALSTNGANATIELSGEQVYDSLAISDAEIRMDSLVATGSVSIANGASLVTESIDAGSLSVDSSSLQVHDITLNGDANFVNAAVTVEDAVTTSVNALNIVADNVTIDADTVIDLNGKGYPQRTILPGHWGARVGCHAGDSAGSESVAESDCAYGRYTQARFAGNGGRANDLSMGIGGGVFNLTATNVTLNGVIRANGLLGDNTHGAGGSIHIEADSLRGSTGRLRANGVEDGESSSGGRISIYADTSGYNGQIDYQAYGGNYSGTHLEIADAGAGTIYVKEPADEYGTLIVSNSGVDTSPWGRTPIEHIGRHAVTGVEDLGNDQWRISTVPENTISFEDWTSVTNAQPRYTFSVPVEQDVNIDVAAASLEVHSYLFHDDGDLTSDDLIASSSNDGAITATLQSGNYVLALAPWMSVVDDVVSGSAQFASLSYLMFVDTDGATPPWIFSSPTAEQGIQGLTVDLDHADDTSPLYEVVSHDRWSLVVNSTVSPADVGDELIGVQRLQSLITSGGIIVDFGGDRVEIDILGELEVRDARIDNVELNEYAIQSAAQSGTTGGSITLTEEVSVQDLTVNTEIFDLRRLTVANELRVDSQATLAADTIQAGTLVVDNATLVAETIDTDGDINITGGGILTVKDWANWHVYQLSVQSLNGVVRIGIGSGIELTGKGYPAHLSAPVNNGARLSCGGGNRGDAAVAGTDCSAGTYSYAQFAGSGGLRWDNTRDSGGGGYVSIVAQELQLDGYIHANGVLGQMNGAGGGVHIETDTLAGIGTIQANGLGDDASFVLDNGQSGGGRISIYSDVSSYDLNNIEAYGGDTLQAGLIAGGAGTIFVQQPHEILPHLIVNNGGAGITTSTADTPIRSVGAQTVTRVDDLGNDQWRVSTLPAGSIYLEEPTDVTNDMGMTHFSIPTDQSVDLRFPGRMPTMQSFIFLDDGDLTVDDFVSSSNELGNQLNVPLTAGNYVVVVAPWESTVDQAANGTNPYTGFYQIVVSTSGMDFTWEYPFAFASFGFGVVGFTVDLDNSDGLDQFHDVVDNDRMSIVVNSTTDISGIVGNELIGVHQFQTLEVGNGAFANFGDDKVIVNNISGSNIQLNRINAAPNSVLQ